MQLNPEDLVVSRVPSADVESPYRPAGDRFVEEDQQVLFSSDASQLGQWLLQGQTPPCFEMAGPRRRTFADPRELTCGIVTCGGLCPGVNNVIRALVLALTYGYGVGRVLGFRYGYAGLSSKSPREPMVLTPEVVDTIHQQGGTVLSSSRGPQDAKDMVDTLLSRGVGALFTIGGDGTLRGTSALAEEIARRNLAIPVVGIPKTIDNDIEWVDRSFGFVTAVEEAKRAISAAHVEARGALNGVGLVKLMGRQSGFIAAHATLSSSDVNFCLVPEVRFALEGDGGLLRVLERRLERRHHAVIAVAEGAGQELMKATLAQDASGNARLGDVGSMLHSALGKWFSSQGMDVTIKYIDPSYMVRSLPANSVDSEFCLLLGQHAVHAAMAGRTNMMIGFWNQHFTHVPIPVAVRQRKQIDPDGELWQRVLDATGQPAKLAD